MSKVKVVIFAVYSSQCAVYLEKCGQRRDNDILKRTKFTVACKKLDPLFLSPPVLMHGGLLGIAFCPSGCPSVCLSVRLSVRTLLEAHTGDFTVWYETW